MALESEYGITDIVIMGDLYIVEQYDVLKLGGIADDTVFPDNRAAPDKGTVRYAKGG